MCNYNYKTFLRCFDIVLYFVSTSNLCFDNKRSVSSNGNLLLHDAEAVEPADEQPGTV